MAYKSISKRPGPDGHCMWGRIYTEEKCKICGNTYNHDENRRGLFCPDHPEQEAKSKFIVRFGRKITKRASTYREAEHLLNGLRWEVNQGTFDAKDYQSDAPYGFTTLANKYLANKKRQGLKSLINTKKYVSRACKFFGQKNVKSFKRTDISDFVYGIANISEKTRHNHMSCIRDFFNNLYKDEFIEITQIPRMPDVVFELGYRKITDLETQGRIIAKVREITAGLNPKIALGIDMLALYTNIRPHDLLNVKEADIDSARGVITFWRPTKKKEQLRKVTVRLIDEHNTIISELKSRYPALPDVKFFRHTSGVSGVKADEVFGDKYFYKYWVKACDELGISGLDLYGGTRHTTVTALAKEVGEVGAKKASGHDTNAAFNRYCQYQDDDTFEMVQVVAKLKGKIIDFEKKKTSAG